MIEAAPVLPLSQPTGTKAAVTSGGGEATTTAAVVADASAVWQAASVTVLCTETAKKMQPNACVAKMITQNIRSIRWTLVLLTLHALERSRIVSISRGTYLCYCAYDKQELEQDESVK
jgi:hypothetical protein